MVSDLSANTAIVILNWNGRRFLEKFLPGVLQHSDFKQHPFRRLIGTVRSMSTLVYGGSEATAAESRRLRALHRSIRGVDAEGKRYHSLDPAAWTWVYATLVKGSLDA